MEWDILVSIVAANVWYHDVDGASGSYQPLWAPGMAIRALIQYKDVILSV